jgi:CheY-like chemotaxis protein
VASTGEEALRRVDELRPDVVLIDIDLGGESGLELAGRLNHQEDLGTRIILISSHDEEDYRDLIAASPGSRVPVQGHPFRPGVSTTCSPARPTRRRARRPRLVTAVSSGAVVFSLCVS